MWSGMEVSFVEWRKVKWSCVVLCCVEVLWCVLCEGV